MSNRVPAESVIPYVREYLEAQDDLSVDDHDKNRFPGPVQVLAERVGIHPDTMRAYLSGKLVTIDFDIADRMLCKIGRVGLWRTALLDLYEAIDLTSPSRYVVTERIKTCAAPSCGVQFAPHPLPQGGGRARLYCSTKCRIRAANIRMATKRRNGKAKRYGSPYDACVNGHDRSEENTYYYKGRRMCRGCLRENAQKTRARKREQVAA